MANTDYVSLSLIISVMAFALSGFSFWWANMRGPKIFCSLPRYLTLGQHGNGGLLGMWITFSNKGSTTGIIESILVLFNELSGGHKEPFSAYNEDYDARNPDITPSAIDRPLLPFAIEPKASVTKKILFVNPKENINFRFKKGDYLLEVYCSLSGKKKFHLYSKRKIRINEDIEIGHALTTFDIIGTDDFLLVPHEVTEIDWQKVIE